ncbi:MAG: hypothetical protein ABH854_01175 [Candidatus Diapherotrites archaeon]|nr:hypothetical protein [Candidatus Micrarchaeota archaeon]MBU1940000.1 hypothetical protein [Candidatus Micrarchaeota archaeon]
MGSESKFIEFHRKHKEETIWKALVKFTLSSGFDRFRVEYYLAGELDKKIWDFKISDEPAPESSGSAVFLCDFNTKGHVGKPSINQRRILIGSFNESSAKILGKMPPSHSYGFIRREILSGQGGALVIPGSDEPVLSLPSNSLFDSLLKFIKTEGLNYKIHDSFPGKSGSVVCSVEVG